MQISRLGSKCFFYPLSHLSSPQSLSYLFLLVLVTDESQVVPELVVTGCLGQDSRGRHTLRSWQVSTK